MFHFVTLVCRNSKLWNLPRMGGQFIHILQSMHYVPLGYRTMCYIYYELITHALLLTSYHTMLSFLSPCCILKSALQHLQHSFNSALSEISATSCLSGSPSGSGIDCYYKFRNLCPVRTLDTEHTFLNLKDLQMSHFMRKAGEGLFNTGMQ